MIEEKGCNQKLYVKKQKLLKIWSFLRVLKIPT